MDAMKHQDLKKKIIFLISHDGTKLKCEEENKLLAGTGFTLTSMNEHHHADSETGLDFMMFPELEFSL